MLRNDELWKAGWSGAEIAATEKRRAEAKALTAVEAKKHPDAGPPAASWDGHEPRRRGSVLDALRKRVRE